MAATLIGNDKLQIKPYDPKRWGTETLLSEREEAPKKGILIPEYNYRIYQKALDRWENLEPIIEENHRQDLLESCVPRGTSWELILATFAVGVALGLAAGVQVRK